MRGERVRHREVKSLAHSVMQPVRSEGLGRVQVQAALPRTSWELTTRIAAQDPNTIGQFLQVATTLAGQLKKGTQLENLILHGLTFPRFMFVVILIFPSELLASGF